jgi:hypothetical protein
MVPSHDRDGQYWERQTCTAMYLGLYFGSIREPDEYPGNIESNQEEVHMKRQPQKNRFVLAQFVLAMTVGATSVSAQTYVSAEPIPSPDVVGAASLASIESIGYPSLELWSKRLLNDCQIVQNVINVLSDNRAISTVIPGNTAYRVGAGGFQGVTDPSYVLTILNSGPAAASASDIFVIDNALGYVLNQSGTAQFSLPGDKKNPFEFALDYAVVTHAGSLTGVQAKAFFDYLGTVDPTLWSGTNAGFTQIDLNASGLNDSMLFLIGKVSKAEFIKGLYAAATTSPDNSYAPIAANEKPTTASAGVAFPGNDWVAFPGGDGYLANLGNSSPQLLNGLAGLRQKHLQAVAALVQAINAGTVSRYLTNQFKCQ